MEQKTPLYERHVAAGGRMVPFAGYLLPVQYADGILAEHLAVRQGAGLFDVSHMGEVHLTGPGALASLDRLLTNQISTLAPGRVRYALMCNPQGGVVDDILVYCMDKDHYMLVLNAANHPKDVAWIEAHLGPDTALCDASQQTAPLALQGPEALGILQSLCAPESIPPKHYSFVENAVVGGLPCLLSRTGYTGEDGFELYLSPDSAPLLWDQLVAAGAVLCGLGARDTLRLEAAMPLYGHELGEEITPLEAGLSPFVKMQKDDFIGKTALLAGGPPRRKRIGLEMTGRGIAREGSPVFAGAQEVGFVTSGTFAPFLKKAVAMALVQADAELSGPLEADIRGRRVQARAVPLPFYKRG